MSLSTWNGLQLVSLVQPPRRKIPNLHRLQRKPRQSQRRVRAESGVTVPWAAVGGGRGAAETVIRPLARCPSFFLQIDCVKRPLKSGPLGSCHTRWPTFSFLVEGYGDRIFESVDRDERGCGNLVSIIKVAAGRDDPSVAAWVSQCPLVSNGCMVRKGKGCGPLSWCLTPGMERTHP